jgi:hypothetical protein
MPSASTAPDLWPKSGRYLLETRDSWCRRILFTRTQAIGFDTALPANPKLPFTAGRCLVVFYVRKALIASVRDMTSTERRRYKKIRVQFRKHGHMRKLETSGMSTI